jgi:hypothetical protein
VTFLTFSLFLHTQTDVFLFFNPQQNRHPERSAAQIYLITDGSWRAARRACPERSRGNPGDACWPLRFEAFQPQTTGEIKKVTSSERSRAICGFTFLLRQQRVKLSSLPTSANQTGAPAYSPSAQFCSALLSTLSSCRVQQSRRRAGDPSDSPVSEGWR